MSAIDDVVLKLTTYMPGGMEWKPDLHPRDHTGKFKKKFGGVFNALSGLKAGKYGNSTVYKGQAGYDASKDASVPEVEPGHKIGGVEVHAPTEHGYAASVHHVDWHLAPGEKVYGVHGGPTFAPEKGATGVIIHHNDGSASVLMPTAEGEMPKVGATSTHFSDLANNLTSIGYTIDTEHPLDFNDELEAQNVQQEMAAVEHAKEIGAAPESAYGKKDDGQINGGKSEAVDSGSEKTPVDGEEAAPKPTYQEGHVGPGGNKIVHMLQDDAGNHVGHVEQLESGKYTSHNAKGEKVGNITKHLPTAVEKAKSGKLTTPSTYQHKKPLKKAAAEEAKKAEPKAEISPEKKVEEPKPEPKQLVKEDVGFQSIPKVGHIQEHEDGSFTAHNHVGEQIGPAHPNKALAQVAVKKVHVIKTNAEKAAKAKEEAAAAKAKADEDAKVQAELKAKADAEEAAKKAEPQEPAHLEGKKVFQHVHDEQGNHLGHIEKTPEGKYTSHDAAGNKVGNITKHLPTAIEKVKSGKLTTPEKKTKDDVTPVEAEVKDVSATEKHLTGENGQYIGKLVKDETTGKWQSYDASGEKLGYTISNTQTAIDKIKVAAAKNPGLADKKQADDALNNAMAESEKALKEEPLKVPVTSVDGQIGHLEEGDGNKVKAIYKDGSVLGEFSGVTAAQQAVKKHHIDTVQAEAQKAKLDDLKKSNDEVAAKVAPTEVDTAAGKVPLLPGQAAYLSKNNAGKPSTTSPWVAVVQDGKVLHIYNPSTGETKDHTHVSNFGSNLVDGWQKSLDEGSLLKAGEESPEKTPVIPEAEKAVAEASTPDDESGFTHANFGEYGQHTVILQPGDKLWTPTNNPSWGVWVEKANGKADGYTDSGHKVVSDSNLPSGLENSGWKVTDHGPDIVKPEPSAPDAAPAAEIYKNSMTGAEFHFDANGIATLVLPTGSKTTYNAATSASLHTSLAETLKDDAAWSKAELPIPEDHAAPHGATPEPVKKVAAKKAAAKKKLTDADLPKEYEFGGKIHKLKPGDSLWTKDVDGDKKVYAVSGISGKGTVYNSDATTNYYLGDSNKKVSLAALKKNGWEKVAVGDAKQEIAGPEAAVDLSLVPENYSGGKNVYSYADQVFNALSGWSSKLNKNDYDAADPEWGKDIAQYAANLAYIKANPEEFDLDKSDKMKVTKALTHANNLWKLHVIATKVNDPNYETNQQDKTALEEVKAYSDKVNTHYVGSALSQLATKIKTADFQQGLKDLGFDLNHGSHEEFVNYAKNEGASFLGGMDETMVKDWTNLHLGTPSYYPESGLTTKSAIENKASQLLKMKAVAANAQSVAEKKAAMQPTKEEKLVEKATTKQYESLYKKVGKLHSAYFHSDDAGYEIVYDPSIGQFHGYGPGMGALGETTSRYFSPEGLVNFLADHSEWNNKAAGSSALGNAAQQKINYLKVSEGVSDEQLINVPAWLPDSLGSLTAEQMTDTQRSDWLTAYVTGDKVAQYQIEKEAVANAGLDDSYLHDHPGNPDNETGQLAVQTLANHLNTLPYWANKNSPYDVTTWSPTELKSFADEFGLTDAFQARDMPEISDKYKVQHWLVWHDQLPEPQNKPVADVSKLNTPEGVSFDVPAGAYVTFNGTNHTIFTDNDGFYVVKSDGTETQHFKYSPGDGNAKDKVSAHAFTLAQGNEKDVTPKWPHSAVDDFFSNMIADFTSAGHVSAQKPSDVSQQVWEFVHGAEAGGKDLVDFVGPDIAKADDDSISTQISGSGLWNREERLKLMATSPAIRKLAAWAASNVYGDQSEVASDVSRALKAKLNNGDYITPETETWVHPESGKSFPIPPGASVYDLTSEYGPGTYAVAVHSNLAYRITPQGAVMSLPTSYITVAKQNGKEVFTSKANLSFEKAGSEGESFTEHAFKKVDDAEAQEVWKSHENETVAAFKFQQAAKKIDGGEKYAQLTHYLHTFPVGVKQLAMESAQKKDTDTLDALVWKFHKGVYAIAPEVHNTPVVDPTASYAQHMGSGQFSSDTIYNSWSTEDMDSFIADHNVPNINKYSDYYDKSSAISQFIPSLIPPTVTTEDKIAKGLADYHNLDLVPTDKSYGGMHSKQGWTDQFGQEWMSKGFNSDPNGNFRVDVEHEANLIGKIFGFNSATTFTKEVGGKYSVVQKIADNIGDLKGFQPKDLNDPQLIGTMQEHILDWLIANHDSHEENLLRLPNGESMLGIDKGQAFKHLGKDKLAVGYLPPENGAPVWYDRFYNALTSGQIDQERADRIAYSVLAKAYAVQSRNDSLYREHLEKAFAQRPDGTWPSHLNTKEKFLDYAMERKANLLKDFSEFYQGLYKKAGYDWTIDTEAFGKNVGGAHIANSPVYVNEVKEATAFGKALMFNSPDLEDAHIMHNTMEQMNGGTALLGYGKVRSDADKALTEWLRNRVEGKLSHGQQAYVPEVAKPEAQLPLVGDLHNAIVQLSKTIAQHATNGGKEPDGQYNQGSIDSAKNWANTVQLAFDSLKKHRAQNPDKLYDGLPLTTLEQQDAWAAAAEQKLQEYDLAAKAHAANTPVKTLYPDAVPFEPISYTPSKGLTHHNESKPAEKYVLDSGEHAVKTSDGGHYLLDKDGGKTWVSAQDYGNHVASGKQVSIEEPSTWTNSDASAVWTKNQDGQWDNGHGQVVDEPKLMAFINASPSGEWTYAGTDEQKEETQTVQISGKTFKVTHRKAALHGGVMDIKTGKLIEKSKQSSALQNGYEYTIEHGKVKIHYRPWTEPGVVKAQQGVLHYEIRDWDGGHEAIDDVLDTLRIAGLDLTPADAESLEHHYWNHLTNVIQDRADSHDSKNKSVIDAVKQARLANPNMTTGESLTALKDAWAKSYGKDMVDRAVWEPQFGKHFDQENVGRPYWYRPDVGVEGLKALYGYRLPIHSIQANSDSDAADRTHSVLMGGGLMSTEERPRVLGSAVEGMSSGPDQGHGSSGFVFTRQNMSVSSSGHDSGPMMVIDPLAALRTSNYAFPDDNYGEIDSRKDSAYFDPKQMYTISGSGNEMMVKHEAPIFAAVFGSKEAAQKEISRLHDAGVFEINGRKVEDVVLWQEMWNNTYQERIDKLWKDLLEAEKKYTEGGV